jgi:hypothetical protein
MKIHVSTKTANGATGTRQRWATAKASPSFGYLTTLSILGITAMQKIKHSVKEVTGTFEEFKDMPCHSLQVRCEATIKQLDHRVEEFDKELNKLLQGVGDGIADLLEQVSKNDFEDSKGHPLKLNKQMSQIPRELRKLIQFRAKWMGYDNGQG